MIPAVPVNPGILDIAPYVPGRSTLSGVDAPIKLSSNETPLGPSPAAVAAFQAASSKLERYPDGAATELRAAIGAAFGLAPERIICGNGSDELFHLIGQAYLAPGDEAIYTEHGFLVYPIVIRGNGATPIVAPELALTADVDAILARVSPRTRVVFLANPNNPTGTMIGGAALRRLRAGLPDACLLVLDGAYAEYAGAGFDDGRALCETSNTIVTRTFSKVHGLAAARVGWGYGPAEVIDVLGRIRSPFNLNGPGLAAAVEALGDSAHLAAAQAHNERWRAWLTAELRALGLDVPESAANFLLIRCGSAERAAAADAFLAERRLILRRVSAYGLPDALRLTVGLEAENRAVVGAFAALLAR